MARCQERLGMKIIYCERTTNDREEFIEDKIQLSTALHYTNLVYAHTNQPSVYTKTATCIGHGKHPKVSKWPRRSQLGLVERYADSPTFKKYCNRKYVITEFHPDKITAATEEFMSDHFVLKHCGNKQASLCYFSRDTAQEKGQLLAHYEYIFAQLEGDKCMLQEYTPMDFEYRIFVVDGVPITGAGCLEDRTPLENMALWDPMMQRKRNSSAIEEDLSLCIRYRDFARKMAPLFKEEGILDYTLDLFSNSNGIGIIELNPIAHSGLYAIDYDALFKAILEVK